MRRGGRTGRPPPRAAMAGGRPGRRTTQRHRRAHLTDVPVARGPPRQSSRQPSTAAAAAQQTSPPPSTSPPLPPPLEPLARAPQTRRVSPLRACLPPRPPRAASLGPWSPRDGRVGRRGRGGQTGGGRAAGEGKLRGSSTRTPPDQGNAAAARRWGGKGREREKGRGRGGQGGGGVRGKGGVEGGGRGGRGRRCILRSGGQGEAVPTVNWVASGPFFNVNNNSGQHESMSVLITFHSRSFFSSWTFPGVQSRMRN